MIARGSFRAGTLTVDGTLTPSVFLTDFYRAYVIPRLPESGGSTDNKYVVAINHLARHLDRPARLSDLTSGTLTECVAALAARPAAAATTRDKLLALARQAINAGLLTQRPRVAPLRRRPAPPRPRLPWGIGELERILASGRAMPGQIDGISARLWWPALLLLLLDTGASLADTLAMQPGHYDRRTGIIGIGPLRYALHSLTIAALAPLAAEHRPRLLPWPFDNGRPPFHMLYRGYRHLLYRASLPAVPENLFQRLQLTAEAAGDVLDRLDPAIPFSPRPGRPVETRARARRKWLALDGRDLAAALDDPDSRPVARPVKPDHVHLVKTCAADSLLRFFDEFYAPRRLSESSAATIALTRGSLLRLCEFRGCELTLSQLSDELLEDFKLWARRGRSNHTVNKFLRNVLAVWRYAWRKKRIESLPRDVETLPTPKRLPEAWSLDEFAKILDSSQRETEHIGRIPAAEFWPALLLTLYDTGLRITAALLSRSERLRDGWLSIGWDTQKQRADQVFRLHPDTLEALRRIGAADREFLFPVPWKCATDCLQRRLRRIIERAGLPAGRRDLFHKVRRMHGTNVADATDAQTAQKALGHASLQTTMRYLDPRKIGRPQPADFIARPVWRPAAEAAAELCDGDRPRQLLLPLPVDPTPRPDR